MPGRNQAEGVGTIPATGDRFATAALSRPAWNRNLWFEWFMARNGDYYETSVPSVMPDAYLIEVADIAQGIPGYVTSLPQKLTDAPVEERNPHQAPWQGPVEK